MREFLEARFRSHDGDAAVAELHRRTAAAVADADWRVAAHHYREAGDTADMLSTISRAIPTIMGNGQYGLAETFIGPVPAEDRPPGFELILSRVEMQQGDYDAAIERLPSRPRHRDRPGPARLRAAEPGDAQHQCRPR